MKFDFKNCQKADRATDKLKTTQEGTPNAATLTHPCWMRRTPSQNVKMQHTKMQIKDFESICKIPDNEKICWC